jgi:hypothetical protein
MPFYFNLPPREILDALDVNDVFQKYRDVDPPLSTETALLRLGT